MWPRLTGLIVIERVPARVCLETGEKLYSPETVERIQAMAWGHASHPHNHCSGLRVF